MCSLTIFSFPQTYGLKTTEVLHIQWTIQIIFMQSLSQIHLRFNIPLLPKSLVFLSLYFVRHFTVLSGKGLSKSKVSEVFAIGSQLSEIGVFISTRPHNCVPLLSPSVTGNNFWGLLKFSLYIKNHSELIFHFLSLSLSSSLKRFPLLNFFQHKPILMRHLFHKKTVLSIGKESLNILLKSF